MIFQTFPHTYRRAVGSAGDTVLREGDSSSLGTEPADPHANLLKRKAEES